MIIISRMYKNHTHYVWIVFNECVRVGQTLTYSTPALRSSLRESGRYNSLLDSFVINSRILQFVNATNLEGEN